MVPRVIDSSPTYPKERKLIHGSLKAGGITP